MFLLSSEAHAMCSLHSGTTHVTFYYILQHAWWFALVVAWIQLHITAAQLATWPLKLMLAAEATHI